MYDSNIEQHAAAVCESNFDVCDVYETPEYLHGNENDYFCECDVCDDSDVGNDTDSSSCRSNDYSDEIWQNYWLFGLLTLMFHRLQ